MADGSYMDPDQLRSILQRLDRIERMLGIGKPAPPTAPPPQARPRKPVVPPPTPARRPQRAAPMRRAPARPVAPRRPARKPASEKASLEVRIGQKWMAWVGAIVIVIGAGFLAKLGYDSGWWGSLPPLAKCLLIAAFGAMLLVAGQLALWRLGTAASVGLLGAALGTLYLDAFAAFQHFDLLSREGAFILMGLVALLGFGLTLQCKSLTIGVLSIIGGYLTPVLLSGRSTHTVLVGVYLTMLLVVSLGLSAMRPRPFRPLRYVGLGALGLVGLGWMVNAVPGSWTAALVFATLWWGIVLIELLAAALRDQSPYGNAVASLLATAWFVTAGAWVLAAGQPPGFDWLGVFSVSVGAVAAAAALHFGPSPVELSRRPRSAIDKLAVSLWAQAGILLAVSVALQFDEYGQSIGWLAVGLGAIELGRRLAVRTVAVFGLLVLFLALVRVVFLDYDNLSLQGPLLTVGAASITGWGVLALASVLTMHAAARRLHVAFTAMPIVLTALAMLGWLWLCADQCSGVTITGGWLLGAAALLSLQPYGGRQRYLEIGLLLLVAAAGRWLMIDATLPRVSPSWDPTARLPFLNAQMGMAVAITLVGWWAARLIARRPSDAVASLGSSFWQVAVAAAALLILVAASFEVDRIVGALAGGDASFAWSLMQVRQLLLTMLWALGALGIGVLARSLTGGRGPGAAPRVLVHLTQAVLAFCLVKWLVSDTLYWAAIDGAGRTAGALPVANIQMLTGAVIAAAVVVLCTLTGSGPQQQLWGGLKPWVPVAATVVLLWGLSFEVDRLIGRIDAGRPPGWSHWNPGHLRELWILLLWAAGGFAMVFWSRLRGSPSMLLAGSLVLAAAAALWLIDVAVGWGVRDGVEAPVIFNVQFLVGALTAALLAVGLRIRRLESGGEREADVRTVGLALIGLIGLALGTAELNRLFAPEAARLGANTDMARQTALSIYWGLYAIGLVALGFARRSRIMRYAGLALLTITLGKVVTVDLADVDAIYRVLSFLGVGMLLVLTSIGYARWAGSTEKAEAAEKN